MVYNFVVDMLGGPLPTAYAFIPYLISGLVLFVFIAITFNFFGNLLNQFFFKS